MLSLSFNRNRAFLFLAGLFLITTTKLFAADTMPVADMETKSTAKVSSAEALKNGQMSAGVSIHSSESPVPSTVLGASRANETAKISERIQQMSAMFGMGVASFLELGLAVHGTSEKINDQYRDELFGGSESSSLGEDKSQETSFSGVSGLAKLRLINRPGVKVAFAPFVKSGAGDSSKESLSRSEKMTGGWMGIFSYGAQGVAEINLNGGMRYREPERVGSVLLRNEIFYQGSVEGFVSREVSLFLAGSGRKIKVAADEDQAVGDKRVYKNWDSGEGYVGATALLNGFRVSAYGGKKMSEASLGGGELAFGIGLGYVFKEKSSTAPMSTDIAEIEKSQEQEKADDQKQIENWDPKVTNEETKSADGYTNKYVDPFGKEVVIFEDVENTAAGKASNNGEKDDFNSLKERFIKKNANKKAEKLSETEIAEKELDKIKQIDEKVSQENAKRQQIEMEQDRLERFELNKANELKSRRLQEDVRKETNGLPTVSDEDVNWDGLN